MMLRALLFVFLSVCTSYGLTIDSYLIGPMQLIGPDQTLLQTNLNEAHVIGGERSFLTQQFTSDDFSIAIVNGTLVVDSENQIGSRGYFLIEYGHSAPLNADLSGFSALRFTYSDVTAGPSTSLLAVTLESGDGNRVRYITTFDSSNIGVVDYSLAFATASGVDVSDIDRIALDAIRFGASFTLSSVIAVPEPTSVVPVLGLFCWLIGGQVRRQQQHSKNTLARLTYWRITPRPRHANSGRA